MKPLQGCRGMRSGVDHRIMPLRGLHRACAAICLLAIFMSAGGHWAVLQSLAYTRMLLEFAEQDSWCVAVKKTFDERYACPLCPKIRDGFNKEQKIPSSLSEAHQPEFLLQANVLVVFTPVIVEDVALALSRRTDLSNGPPKPPPKAA